MRALVCTQIGEEGFLEVQDLPPRPCGPTQLRIAVAAASVNFPDVLIIRDECHVKQTPPFVPGNACAGTVTEVGANVNGVHVGDRVLRLTGTGCREPTQATERTGSLLTTEARRLVLPRLATSAS